MAKMTLQCSGKSLNFWTVIIRTELNYNICHQKWTQNTEKFYLSFEKKAYLTCYLKRKVVVVACLFVCLFLLLLPPRRPLIIITFTVF